MRASATEPFALLRHLLWGNDLKAAGVGILSQAINVFSMDAPLVFNHSPMSLAASFP